MGELINGRMPEHIKAGLRCRVAGDVECSDCAYYGTVLYEIGQREYECDDIDRDALALIERLEAAQPKWISVKERLPEKAGKYIVCTRKMSVYCTAFRFFHGKGYFATDSTTHITHWMPLPEPPKEGE
jgi:hypothetical protein